MKKNSVILFLILSTSSWAQTMEKDFPEMFTVTVSNPGKTAWENVWWYLPKAHLHDRKKN